MPKTSTAKQRLLKAAAELFYVEGIASTGIDAITARAGVAKMSLYNNFSSKAELVQSYLQSRCADWLWLYQQRLATARTPRECVLAVFDSYIDHAAQAYEWGFRGCGLLNAAAELPVDDPGRITVQDQKLQAETFFRQHLSAMQLSGGTMAGDLAQHLSFILEGAMARAGLERTNERLHAARQLVVSLLDQHPQPSA